MWIAPTDTSSNSVQQQNSSRDLKGRETRKQGTQPQHQERERLTLPSRWWPRYLRFLWKKPLTNVHEVKNKRGKTNKKHQGVKAVTVLNRTSLRVAAPSPDKWKTERGTSPAPLYSVPNPSKISLTRNNFSLYFSHDNSGTKTDCL